MVDLRQRWMDVIAKNVNDELRAKSLDSRLRGNDRFMLFRQEVSCTSFTHRFLTHSLITMKRDRLRIKSLDTGFRRYDKQEFFITLTLALSLKGEGKLEEICLPLKERDFRELENLNCK